MNIIQELEKYIKRNPDLLNNAEKGELRKQLMEYVNAPEQGVKDFLFDFFVYSGIVQSPDDYFIKYIMENYPPEKFPKVLEVATGKVCSLGRKLKQNGYKVTAMDPNLRIASNDSRVKGIKLIKRKFTPDFSVLPYDIVIGNNACPVAGTLLKINKFLCKKRKLTYKCRINIIQKVISEHNIPKEE